MIIIYNIKPSHRNFKSELKRMDGFLREIYSQIGEMSFTPPSELNGELQILRFGSENPTKLNKLGSITKSVLRGRKTKFQNKKLNSKKKQTKTSSLDKTKANKVITGIKDIVTDSKEEGSVKLSKKKSPKKGNNKKNKKNKNNNNGMGDLHNDMDNITNNNNSDLVALLVESKLRKYKSHHNLSLIGKYPFLPPI